MAKWQKILERVMSGKADAGIAFDDLCHLLAKLDFTCRVRGSHHNFRREGFEAVNLQPAGRQAKQYQVKQVRETLKKRGL